MTGIRTFFKAHNAEVQRMLERHSTPDTGERSLAPRLGEYLEKSTQRRFDPDVQRSPDGTPWEALKPGYLRQKKYHKDKILTLRGYLCSTINYSVIDANTVEVGSNLKYAAIHQFGGVIQQAPQSRKVRYRSVAGRVLFAGKQHKRATERWVTRDAYQVKIPARPFMGISAEDDAQIQRLIADWVSEHG